MYRYYNANPKNNKILDCAIRSLSVALDIPWRTAYQELSNNGRRLGLMMDSVENVEDYLNHHFDKETCRATPLREFVRKYRKGVFIISQNGHLTTSVDGQIIDIFDPSDDYIKCAWRVK